MPDMKIEEITRIQISFGKNAKRKWDLLKMSDLRESIEECLRTGKEVFHRNKGEVVVYHVTPDYPLIASAMASTCPES